jgi:hypothetical protein
MLTEHCWLQHSRLTRNKVLTPATLKFSLGNGPITLAHLAVWWLRKFGKIRLGDFSFPHGTAEVTVWCAAVKQTLLQGPSWVAHMSSTLRLGNLLSYVWRHPCHQHGLSVTALLTYWLRAPRVGILRTRQMPRGLWWPSLRDNVAPLLPTPPSRGKDTGATAQWEECQRTFSDVFKTPQEAIILK